MSDMDKTGACAAMAAVLARAGLPVKAEERERSVRTFSFVQGQLAALRIPEVRYGEPAIIESALSAEMEPVTP